MSRVSPVREFTRLAIILPVFFTIGCPGDDESQQGVQSGNKSESRITVPAELEHGEPDDIATEKPTPPSAQLMREDAITPEAEVKGTLAQDEPKQDTNLTTEPTIWSWPGNKKRVKKILDDMHKKHKSIDRIIFDMEEFPVEVEFDSPTRDREGTKENRSLQKRPVDQNSQNSTHPSSPSTPSPDARAP